MKKAIFTITAFLVPMSTAVAESYYSQGYYDDKPEEAAKAFTEASIMATACFRGKANFSKLHEIKEKSGYQNWDGRQQYLQTIEDTVYNQLDGINRGRIDKKQFCQNAIDFYGLEGKKVPNVFDRQ